MFRVSLCYLILHTLVLEPMILAQGNVWDSPQGRERIFTATVNIFKEHYWDPNHIDWESWEAKYKAEAVTAITQTDFDLVMRRMISQLNDQHSRWLGRLPATPSETVFERSLGTEQSYLPGIGLVIEQVYAQSPAEGSLHRGDVIVRINGQDLRDQSSHQIAQLLSEAFSQTEVSLDIRHKQQRSNLRLKPQELNLSMLKNLPVSEMLNASTGYLYIPSFTQAATAERVHQHLADLQAQGAKKLILDLRDNPGGGLGELGLVMCAFLEDTWLQAIRHNQVVWRASCNYQDGQLSNTLSDTQGNILSQDQLEHASFFSGPVIVLVSRFNNSAGEVAALVLQAMSRATVIGEQTMGNVEALQEFKLSDSSVVLVAVANLQGSEGQDFTGGVLPDISSQSSLSELSRGFDAPLAEALKVIEALPFTPGKYF